MTAVAAGGRVPLNIGKVFEQTFQIYGRNIGPLLLGSAVLVAGPQLVVGYVQYNHFRETSVGIITQGPMALLSALTGILFGILSLWFQGGVNRFTNDALSGRKTNLSGNILEIGSLLPSMIGVAILMTLGITLASILLIVPGIMLALAWSIALPALVIEQLGVTRALGRSLELTRGSRWSIFLLGLIFYAVVLTLAGLSIGVTGGLVRGVVNPWRAMLLQPLLTLILSPLTAVGFAVLFNQLRTIREGAGSETTAGVFA